MTFRQKLTAPFGRGDDSYKNERATGNKIEQVVREQNPVDYENAETSACYNQSGVHLLAFHGKKARSASCALPGEERV